jgi:alkaline phosphatase
MHFARTLHPTSIGARFAVAQRLATYGASLLLFATACGGGAECMAPPVAKAEPAASAPTPEPQKRARYVFLFIGDGMGQGQRSAAELYVAATQHPDRHPDESVLTMNSFPVAGFAKTYDRFSVVPDSASAGTALATGKTTLGRVISMDPDGKEPYRTIAETAKAKGWKVGIITSVSIDHATPAVFYAHQPNRDNYYEISLALPESGFDYFAGGRPIAPKGKDGNMPSVLEKAKEKGYSLIEDDKSVSALAPGAEKVWVLAESGGSLPHELDRSKESLALADYVQKGIEVLDNPEGFFMMVEGGKIDWACHANDLGAAVHDTIALDAAVRKAVEFAAKKPDETLIIVTADHETGGLVVGHVSTGYSAHLDRLAHQRVTRDVFNWRLEELKKRTAGRAKWEDVRPLIVDAFGLEEIPAKERAALDEQAKAGDKAAKQRVAMALSDYELGVLKTAFAESMRPRDKRAQGDAAYREYGGQEPLTVKLTTLIANKSGIGFTTYSHSGMAVPVTATGVRSELFGGYYHQTEIPKRIAVVSELE